MCPLSAPLSPFFSAEDEEEVCVSVRRTRARARVRVRARAELLKADFNNSDVGRSAHRAFMWEKWLQRLPANNWLTLRRVETTEAAGLPSDLRWVLKTPRLDRRFHQTQLREGSNWGPQTQSHVEASLKSFLQGP